MKPKKKYPTLSVRVTDEVMAYIRRMAYANKMSLPNYVRLALAPTLYRR